MRQGKRKKKKREPNQTQTHVQTVPPSKQVCMYVQYRVDSISTPFRVHVW